MQNESFEIVQDSSYFKDNSFLSPPNEALRIQENEIQKLKKLNFNLKLRICQLEERLGLELTGNEDVNFTGRVSTYSDSEEKDSPYPSRTSILKELEEEIYRRDLLLTKARNVILSLQKQLSHEDKKNMTDKISWSRQINESTTNYGAELEEIKEESIVPRLATLSQRILQKIHPHGWKSYEADTFPSYANLSYVLNNLTLIEEKVNEFYETTSYTKETPNSSISKFGNSFRDSLCLNYENDKENIQSPYAVCQQSSSDKVQQSLNSSFLKETEYIEKYPLQTILNRLLDSISELGETTFGCAQLLDNSEQVTSPPKLPLKSVSFNLEEIENCVHYVFELQQCLRNVKTKLQSYSAGIQRESHTFQSEMTTVQPSTLEQSLQNSDSALAEKEIQFNSELFETSDQCSRQSNVLTMINGSNSASNEFSAQWNVEEKESLHNILKMVTKFQQSMYFEELEKILSETGSLDARIQQAQQKILKIQQKQPLMNCSSFSLLPSFSKRKGTSFEDESSSDNINGLASVTKYQESFNNLASFVSSAFTMFEEMELDHQIATCEETRVDTTELERLFTWGQKVLAPSPFSPGSNRQQEYVLTVWSTEKTVHEGLNLLRNTAETIKQYMNQEKKQENDDQNLEDMKQLAKSLMVSNNFVEKLAHTIATKVVTSNQKLSNLERRLEDLKNTVLPKTVSERGNDLVMAMKKKSPMPEPLSRRRRSSHKALKKWVLEQISETQRAIQQTQKSLDHERKHLLYNWLYPPLNDK
ncbi:hypothetical protein GpartN1_g246.t1 [Galdieria partita]|uniref:Uncharacterized protein n=1 Tax=Galdieria partita TaxID=83374 RepID=A0A9C7UM73_9RHOD|nr:hypothetical protein GpartN1_g246.t1 [Galdieria partita]